MENAPTARLVFGSWSFSGVWILVLGAFFLAHPSTLHAQPAAPNCVLSLGGTNGFLELPGGAFNDREEVTIEGWVKLHRVGA